jgi:hypothetical protein
VRPIGRFCAFHETPQSCRISELFLLQFRKILPAILPQPYRSRILLSECRGPQDIRKYLERKHQQNLEMIFGKALQELPIEVSVLPVSEDWLLQFVEAAKNVSDEEMHTIWAKILAGEVSNPGTYSKRTLDFIKLLEKQDAETFSTICQYAFEMGNQKGFRFLLSPNTIGQSYHGKVTEQDLSHLNSIGLLRQAEYLPVEQIIEGSILYFHRKLKFEEVQKAPFERMRNTSVLVHPFSMLGQELFGLTHSQAVEGFLDSFLPLIKESLHIKSVVCSISQQKKTSSCVQF